MPISDYYKGEVEKDGVTYHLVDSASLTGLFTELSEQVEYGKKTALTRAYIAKAGEEIITQHASGEESRYVAEGGEIVFDNGGGDQFVPRDDDGKPNGEERLQGKYVLQSGSLENGDAQYMPNSSPSQILIGVNTDPIRIMNPWGEGSTQDLPAGSTLKLSGNKVSGVEREAFEKTWSRTDAQGNILDVSPEQSNVKNWTGSLGERTGRIKG